MTTARWPGRTASSARRRSRVGDHGAGERHFRQQLVEAGRAHDRRGQAGAHAMLGKAVHRRRRRDEATAQLQRALQLFEDMNDIAGIGNALGGLGEVARDAGDAQWAGQFFAAAWRHHQTLGSARGMATDLEGLAATAALRGTGREALVCLGAADALRQRSGGPLPPADRAILGRVLAPALARLSAEERDRSFAEGRDRPPQDAIPPELRDGPPVRC